MGPGLLFMGINEVMAVMALVTTIHWMRSREARG